MSFTVPSPGRSVWYGAAFSDAQYITLELVESLIVVAEARLYIDIKTETKRPKSKIKPYKKVNIWIILYKTGKILSAQILRTILVLKIRNGVGENQVLWDDLSIFPMRSFFFSSWIVRRI
jgi:hypothetical protein